jgi:hypothetical protein
MRGMKNKRASKSKGKMVTVMRRVMQTPARQRSQRLGAMKDPVLQPR